MDLLIQYLFSSPAYYFTWIVVVAFSVCVHEYSHAYVALREGDSTAFHSGHLSLNPFVVMGPVSLACLAVIGIAWGAVPVNKARFRHRYGAALVAFAGPAANLALAILFAFLLALLVTLGGNERLAEMYRLMLGVGSMANFLLFLLNMLPIPMLDGWDVFSYAIPPMRRAGRLFHGEMTWAVIFIVMFTVGFGWLWAAARWLSFMLTNAFIWSFSLFSA